MPCIWYALISRPAELRVIPALFGWDGAKYSTTSWDYQYDAVYQPNLTSPAIQVAKKAVDLNDPNCVFQRLKEQYSILYPGDGRENLCTPQPCSSRFARFTATRTRTICLPPNSMPWDGLSIPRKPSHPNGIYSAVTHGQYRGGRRGINALRGWHNVQGSTDQGILFNFLTGYNASRRTSPNTPSWA